MTAAEERDPVYGMMVKPNTPYQSSYTGTRYNFCGAACRQKFGANPTRYTHSHIASVVDTASTAPDIVYTCPMHPEIRQNHPGGCPKCDMALEPAMPSLGADENPKLAALRRHFWWTLPLAVAVVTLVVLGGCVKRVAPATRGWVELALSTPVVLWTDFPIYAQCLQSFRNRNPNMWTLVGLGTGAAFIYSAAATVTFELFPHNFVVHGRITVYFEAITVIISLTLFGQVFELKARSQTSAAVKSLLGLTPKAARRIEPDGSEEDIPLTHIHIGDLLRTRPDEKVPIDGAMTEGAGTINGSMITGEPLPVSKHPGDHVIGTTLNTSDSPVVRSERVGTQTVLSQIVQMTAQVRRSKAPMQRMADQVTNVFMLVMVAVAVFALFGWEFFGPEPSWVFGLVHAVAALIIACPCALGLATPISIMMTGDKVATQGILFRDVAAIEQFRKVDALIVDKIDTLTGNHPAFEQALDVDPLTEVEVARLATNLNRGNEHPLTATIVTAARERSLALGRVGQFTTDAGIGVRGQVSGGQLILGNVALMQQERVGTEPLVLQADTLRQRGTSVMYLAVDRKLAGLLAASGPIRANTPEALAALKATGIRVVMASGGSIATARTVGSHLGIEEFHGEVRPADELALIAKLQAEGHVVVMTGDGISGALALAEADVNITMGTGTGVAMHSAQVMPVKGDLRGLARARKLSQATIANMKQNLGFAFIYNTLGTPLAVGLLYPFTEWLLSPIIAALAMSLSSVSVIVNALRLRAQVPWALHFGWGSYPPLMILHSCPPCGQVLMGLD